MSFMIKPYLKSTEGRYFADADETGMSNLEIGKSTRRADPRSPVSLQEVVMSGNQKATKE